MSAAPARLDVRVRPYADGDREAVRELLRKTFGSPAVFDRFSTGNPLGGFVAVVAEHESAIVGYNMWNPWLVHGPDGAIVAYQSGASAVDDAMRGQGIFGKLLRTGEELARSRGIAALFGFPNPASLPGFIKAGWEHARSLGMFISPLPSIGVGPVQAAESHGPASSSPAARFVAWRYQRAEVTGRTVVLRGGRRATAYARPERWRGARVNKLLDVIDDDGRRIDSGLGTVGVRLPGPGVAIMRAVVAPRSMPPWLRVRRAWETPLILKPLSAGAGGEVDALRAATYWYGDIDAS